MRGGGRTADESGAYLVLWALMLTAILGMIALVLDLGRLRDTKRSLERTADLAALAGAQDLTSSSGPYDACRRAAIYAGQNLNTTFSSTPCNQFQTTACTPLSARPPATMTAGDYTLTVENPVLDSQIVDPNYPGGTNPDRDGASNQACQRMRVTLARTNTALFARVLGASTLTTRGSAVVRAFVDTKPVQTAGLVLLERKDCAVLVAQPGQGSVLVKGTTAADGTLHPGIIQTSSLASTCSSGGDVANKYVVFGPNLTPANLPSVYAQGIGNTAGKLQSYALAVDPANGQAHAAYDYTSKTGGVSPGPSPGALASRRAVDDVYNKPSGSTAGRVTQFRDDSIKLIDNLAKAVDPAKAGSCPSCNVVPPPGPGCVLTSASYWVYPPGTPTGADASGCQPLASLSPGVAACSNSPGDPLIDIPAKYDQVYLACSDLDVDKIVLRGSKFVFEGVIKVTGSGQAVEMPNAKEIVMQGCGACKPSEGKVSLDLGGAFLVNTGVAPTTGLDCSNKGDDDGDAKIDLTDPGCQDANDWDETSCSLDRTFAKGVTPARFFIHTGPITTTTSAFVQMCQTFVLMGDGDTLPSETKATTGPNGDLTCTDATDSSGVTIERPCPVDNTFKGTVSLFAITDWTAPDVTDGKRNTAAPGQAFEDLALWTETSTTSELKGQGNSVTAGVYFFPNAEVDFSGQATQNIELNAQFLARRLVLSGQSTLTMKPNPEDSVDTPSIFYYLIR